MDQPHPGPSLERRALAVAADGTLAYAVARTASSSTSSDRGKRTPHRGCRPGCSRDQTRPGRSTWERCGSRTGPRPCATLAIDTPPPLRDVWQVAVKSGKPIRWTRSEVGGMDSSRFASRSWCATRRPVGCRPRVPLPAAGLGPGARAPVVVYWHGGPGVQERPKFTAQFRRWWTSGWRCWCPTCGARMAGKACLAADDGVKREALKDIGATLDFIGRQPDLDPSRVAAFEELLRGSVAPRSPTTSDSGRRWTGCESRASTFLNTRTGGTSAARRVRGRAGPSSPGRSRSGSRRWARRTASRRRCTFSRGRTTPVPPGEAGRSSARCATEGDRCGTCWPSTRRQEEEPTTTP